LEIQGVVICSSTTAMRREHINQPNEGCAAKVPATTSRCNERTRGRVVSCLDM
jgi:hypothetical protein